MKIENNKIKECTEDELYDFWLKNWSDLIDYGTYRRRCKEMGMEVRNAKVDKNDTN